MSRPDDEERPHKDRGAYDSIRRVFVEAGALMTDDEHTEFMRAIMKGRKAVGRPAPEFE
jgi:hypothetical protein